MDVDAYSAGSVPILILFDLDKQGALLPQDAHDHTTASLLYNLQSVQIVRCQRSTII